LGLEPLEARTLLDGLGVASGSVFDDFDRDGVRDPWESGLAGWTVDLQRVGSSDVPLATFENPTPDDWSQFGRAVAAVGDNVLVGSHYDDLAAIEGGAAYLFDGETGQLLNTFVSPEPNMGDKFGRAVAGVGGNVLIAAPLDTASLGSGAVYLFDGETYELLHTFVSPTPGQNDQFGRAVTVVGDDILIGARRADVALGDMVVEDAGAVFLFDGETFELLQTFVSPYASTDGQFGYCVAGMGENVLVGSRFDDAGSNGPGAVYLFDGNSGNLLQAFPNPVISATGEASDFGRSVAAVGDNVLVAARYDDSGADRGGSAFLFDAASGTLLQTLTSPTPAPGEQFGYCVAALGNDALVGARWDFRWDGLGDGNGGAAYLFDGATGELLQTFANPVPEAWDSFGMSVSEMGDRVIVGAQFANSAYLFEAIPESPKAVTDADGNFTFTDLQPGTYRVVQFLQEGYVPVVAGGSGAFTITVENDETHAGLDFANTVDQLPFARDDAYTVGEDSTLTVDAAAGLLTNDVDADADPLTAALVNAPPYGTVTLQPDGAFSYTPNENFFGSDSFSYRANDGVGNSNVSVVTITVEAVNDAPVAGDDAMWVFLNTPWTVEAPGVLTDDVDTDGDDMTAALVDPPSHGTVELSADGGYVYTPEAGYTGGDSFTYVANDGTIDSNVATVELTVSLNVPRVLRDHLRITELNYNPYGISQAEKAAGVASRDAFEFIELLNTGRDTLDLDGVQLGGVVHYQFAGRTLIEPGQCVLLVNDRFAFETRYGAGRNVVGEYDGELQNRGGQILLKDPFDGTILNFGYNLGGDWPRWADGFGSTLEIVDTEANYQDGDNWQISAEYGGTPGVLTAAASASVVINEVLAHSDWPWTDSIELYNPTGAPIDVGGWYLSDSARHLKSFRIPDGTIIPADGYVWFDQDDFDFTLDSVFGDEVWLTEADENGDVERVVDQVEFGATAEGESLGRWPTYEYELYPMATITLGGTNGDPRIGPLVITEVMYNPPDPGNGSDVNDLEFIEIYNPGRTAEDMTNWEIGGGVSYNFPSSPPPLGPDSPLPPWYENRVLVPADGTLLIVGFPVSDSAKLTTFVEHYGIEDSVRIVGPYGGSLDNGGERVRLLRPEFPPEVEKDIWLLVVEDEIIYGDTEPWPTTADGLGQSLQRRDRSLWGNDAASWMAAMPTPGSVEVVTLAVTELNYNPRTPTAEEREAGFESDDFEFIEIENIGHETMDLTGLQLRAGVEFDFTDSAVTQLDPGQRVVVVSNRAAFEQRYGTDVNVAGQYAGNLADEGARIILSDPGGRPILDFQYDDGGLWPDRAGGKGSSLQIVSSRVDYNDGASWRASSEYDGSPGEKGVGAELRVVVNEVVSNANAPLTDSIELYNATLSAVDVGGWYLSDSQTNYAKFRIPDGTLIPPGGYAVFDEDDFNPAQPAAGQVRFSLDGVSGDDVWLLEADAAGNLTRFADHVEFGTAVKGQSFGRWPDGQGDLYRMMTRTLGTENSGPSIFRQAVISEIMYHPRDPRDGSTPDNFEFVEFFNPTEKTVDLSDWQVREGIEFDFPEGTTLAPYSTVVVVPFELTDTEKLTRFRIYYGLEESVPLVGGYSSQLANSGEKVQIERPTYSPFVQQGRPLSHVPEDVVEYADADPWPSETDGDGQSLHRVATDSWGNDAASWMAAAPTPGTVDIAIVDMTPPAVIGVSVNGREDQSAGSIDPGAAGIRTIEVVFDEPMSFDPSDVTVQTVTFPGGLEKVGTLLIPTAVTGAHTDTMTISFAEGAAEATWVKVTLNGSTITDLDAYALDGDSPTEGSGLWYLLDAATDLPSGDGVPGGDAIFYVGSLLGDIDGNGKVDGADRNVLEANLGTAGPGDLDGSGIVSQTDLNMLVANLDATLDPLGRAVRAVAGNLVITEINYRPYRPTQAERVAGFKSEEYFEFVELQNISGRTINLTDVRFSGSIEFDFTDGGVDTLEPGEFVVVGRVPPALLARYGSQIKIAGAYDGNLDSVGQLSLIDAFGDPILVFAYGNTSPTDDDAPWPSRANGAGSSLEVVDLSGDYNDWSNWRASFEYGGSPGAEGLAPGGGPVINEVLSNPGPLQAVSVEINNPTDRAVDIGGWYLSNSPANYPTFRIPAGTTIAAGGYLVFYEPFGLSGRSGGTVCLLQADGPDEPIRFVDYVGFGRARLGESFGRWPNASGKLTPMVGNTLGNENSGPRVGPVIISEVMYHPPDPISTALSYNPDELEYIEIYNPTGRWFDLGNWTIRGGIEYEFADDTMLAPGDTLVVLSNDAAWPAFSNFYGLGAHETYGFVDGYRRRLSNRGEGVQLLRPDRTLEDEIDYQDTWYPTTDGGYRSLSRSAIDAWGNDAAGWSGSAPSPGSTPLPMPSLMIAELNYHPYDPTASELAADPSFTADDFGFIEVLNTSGESVSLQGVRLGGGVMFEFGETELAPGARAVVVNNLEAFSERYQTDGILVAGEYEGQLSEGGGQITLLGRFGEELLSTYYGRWVSSTYGEGRSLQIVAPRGGHYTVDFRLGAEYGGSPGFAGRQGPDVVINELLTKANWPQVDAIELHNTTSRPIDVGGWWLSDSSDDYQKFRIPPGTEIPAGGYVVFYEGHYEGSVLLHDPLTEFGGTGEKDFSLDDTNLWLMEADSTGKLTRFADRVDYVFQSADYGTASSRQFARLPNGEGPFYPMSGGDLTLGSDNVDVTQSAVVGPVVISEVMYHPDYAEWQNEFIELYNPMDRSASLCAPLNPWQTWRLSDGIEFSFPAFAKIPAHGVALVVDTAPEEFRASYDVPAGVPIFGPFERTLANSGERFALLGADGLLVVDEIAYDDRDPWPRAADGRGASLTRLERGFADGNDPASWIADSPTPGVVPWRVTEVVGRHVFYNNSAFDGNDPNPGGADDAAIASDKTPLWPGQTASLANYTSYSRGINGIMVDVLAPAATPTADDFLFRVGNRDDPNNWQTGPAPIGVTVRPGAGVGNSDRITITWDDYAIQNQWLQVTVLPEGLGLPAGEVFYFGNAVAEAGNSPDNAQVTSTDLLLPRNNPRNFLDPAEIDLSYDYNRDQRVNVTDVLLARNNQTSFLNRLRLIELSIVLITEVGIRDPDYVEIQNVSSTAVDTSGWVVAANDGFGAVPPDVTKVLSLWELPDAIPGKEVLYANDDLDDVEHYWGGQILWWTAGVGWVMIVDAAGSVVDFVVWGYPPEHIEGQTVEINGHQIALDNVWSGPPLPLGWDPVNSLQRTGGLDRDDSGDWAFVSPPNPGGQNPGLEVPFGGRAAVASVLSATTLDAMDWLDSLDQTASRRQSPSEPLVREAVDSLLADYGA